MSSAGCFPNMCCCMNEVEKRGGWEKKTKKGVEENEREERDERDISRKRKQ